MSRPAASARILATIPFGLLILVLLLIFSITLTLDGNIGYAFAVTLFSLMKISLFFAAIFFIPAVIIALIVFIGKRRQ